jgi:hypothetical protein
LQFSSPTANWIYTPSGSGAFIILDQPLLNGGGIKADKFLLIFKLKVMPKIKEGLSFKNCFKQFNKFRYIQWQIVKIFIKI